MLKILLIGIALTLSLFAEPLQTETSYSFSNFQNGKKSLNTFFSSKGAPWVGVGVRCSKGKNKVCWSVIENQDNRVLRSFGKDDSVSTIATGRYENVAYLYFSHGYKRGKKYYVDYYLMNQNGKTFTTPKGISNSIDSLISINKELVQIAQNGIYVNGSLSAASNENFTHGKITNNLQGDLSFITVTDKHKIAISNGYKWIYTNLELARKGDRRGILSSYPNSKNEIIYSVYKYVNSYNKGLVLGKADFANDTNFHGWLYNSEENNIGFDPVIYQNGGMIYVSAKNSSQNINTYTKTPNNAKLKTIANYTPKHTIGFEEEDFFSFLVGTSLSQLSWEASNEVKGSENDKKEGSVSYEVTESLYTSIYLQGKIGDAQLAISHLKNEAEKKGAAEKKASQFTTIMVDIDGFFSPQSSLRILSEKAEIGGIATIEDKDNHVINANDGEVFEISTDYIRYSAFVMKERGIYYGLDYSEYTMPSLIGYGKDGYVKYTAFDENLNIKKITFNVGYDELSYAKRYENNFKRFYFQGLLGGGVAYLDVDDAIENDIEQRAKNDGYDGIDAPFTLAVDYAADIGYIWQGKSKMLKGLGVSTQIGYKLKGTYYGSGSSSESSSENDDNKLSLEFTRNDIWHGPYISVNIIF